MNPPANAGDGGSIPGLGRSLGERNGNPFQYSCLENPMNRGAWQTTAHGVSKSRTRLSDFTFTFIHCEGLPWWLSRKESTCQCRRHGFSLWAGKIPWRKKWQPIPVLLPGKSHWQRSLVGYSPWGHKRVRHDLATKRQQNGGGSSHRGKGFRIQSP